MRFCLFNVLLILVGWATVTTAGDPLQRATDVLKDDSAIKYYSNCLLDKGPCSADGRALKRLLPDFIHSNCAKCSEGQKQIACKAIFTLKQPKFIEFWRGLLKKYNPNNKYQTNLSDFEQYCKEHDYTIKA